MTIGDKYKWKPNENPPPGIYDIERAVSITKFRNRSAIIKEEVSPYRRPKENPPPIGLYDKHLTPFGSDCKTKITMGNKYVFKPLNGSNPGPGVYEVENSIASLKYKAPSAVIREDSVKYRRPVEPTPEPYDNDIMTFGKGAKNVYVAEHLLDKINQSILNAFTRI